MAKTTIIVGRKPVAEALQSDKKIDSVYLQNNVQGELIHTIIRLARERNIPLKKVPLPKLSRLTNVVHQGVVAFTRLIPYYDLQDVIDLSLTEGRNPFFVILDELTDVRNLGAVIRSAYAMGAEAVVLAAGGTAPLREDTLKTSAGALLKIKVCRVRQIVEALEIFHLNGIITVATTPIRESTKIYNYDFTKPCAIIIGGEEGGIGSAVLKKTMDTVTIPIASDFDSLNASNAAAIVLYEINRQRFQ